MKIGVFDSGVGGLTVLQELLNAIPQADYLYLGDTARLPYGSKSATTIARYAVSSVRFLVDHGAEYLVIACNTASARCPKTHIGKRFYSTYAGFVFYPALCRSRSMTRQSMQCAPSISSQTVSQQALNFIPRPSSRSPTNCLAASPAHSRSR